MSCKWCEARLAPFVDGELTPRDRSLVRRHTNGCPTCGALLAELRVIDGMLAQPRAVCLAADFTRATMAEVRDLPPPGPPRRPIAAFVVCYLVAAWLLLGAAAVLSPTVLDGAASTAFDVGRTAVDAAGGIGRVGGRLAAHVVPAIVERSLP